jgi:MYXO-CTERM domain-containing protein
MAAKFGVIAGFGSVIRRIAAASALFAVVLFAARAHAAGSFKLKSTTVGEVGGSWHVFVKVELPRAPVTAHVPMKFLFTKEAVFERDLVDGHGDTPVTNQMVLTNQTPNVESLDVDFADGSGKIFKGTNFDFSLARERGYEAGVYKVEVRTTDGINIGSGQRLTLNGDNPVVDRRSITFAANPKSKKIPTLGLDAGANGAPPQEDTPTQTTEVSPSGSAAPFIPNDAYQKTPEEEVKTRPAGCGCVTAGASSGSGVAGLGGLGLALLVATGAARRRRVSQAR